MKTLNIKHIAELLQTEVRTIRNDMRRRPNSVPPKLNIPGRRRLIWLESDVKEWLEKCREKKKGRPREHKEAA